MYTHCQLSFNIALRFSYWSEKLNRWIFFSRAAWRRKQWWESYFWSSCVHLSIVVEKEEKYFVEWFNWDGMSNDVSEMRWIMKIRSWVFPAPLGKWDFTPSQLLTNSLMHIIFIPPLGNVFSSEGKSLHIPLNI